MSSRLLLLLLFAAAPAFAQDDAQPWRAHEALGLSWLRFGLEQRTRFEHVENDFRPAAGSDSTGLALRTLLSAELRFLPVVVGFELQDSRLYATRDTPLNTTHVNPLELLQGYVGLRRGALSLTLGRFTMDLGSRRLVARNEFRNTINGFTGVDVMWTRASRLTLRAFAMMPVIRLPLETGALAKNAVAFDVENTSAFFAGGFVSAPLGAEVQVEAYVLGLHESDHPLAPSADRRLVTPGVRLLRPPANGTFDFQLEMMAQLGTSRATAEAADGRDLAHRAFSAHLSAGWRFDVAASPRLALQYDFASGDDDARDGLNGRFDVLFGARRFELGPTGLWGAIARSNLHSPGVRVEVAPHPTLEAFAAYRALWLASPRDAWTTAPLVDPTGASGTFVGHHLEARVRWSPLPRNLALEVGGAWLAQGTFAKSAPGARGGDSVYAYAQLVTAL